MSCDKKHDGGCSKHWQLLLLLLFLSVTVTHTAEFSSLQYINSVVRFHYSEHDVCHSLSKHVLLIAAWSL